MRSSGSTTNKIDYRVLIAVIFGIVALELGAMFNGINGFYLTIAIGILALIAGISMPQWFKFK